MIIPLNISKQNLSEGHTIFVYRVLETKLLRGFWAVIDQIQRKDEGSNVFVFTDRHTEYSGKECNEVLNFGVWSESQLKEVGL